MAAAADIDGLFQLPLTEFTSARNALAATMKRTGHEDEAQRIKALAKPPVSAWTVNQLYWRHRTIFNQLIAAGERLRNAQASRLAGKGSPRRTPASWGAKGGDMRAPLEARRAALSDLTKLAAALLRETGHIPAPEMMRRITMTLEALATHGSHPNAPPPGRLTDDIDPPGFEALAALVPGRGGRARGNEPTRVIPFRQRPEARTAKKKVGPKQEQRQREEERKARLAAAKSAVHDAERALREARKSAEQAEAALKKAAAHTKEAEKRKTELDKRLEKAATEADQARQDARRVAADAESAAQAVADAEHALDQARRTLEVLLVERPDH